MKERSVTAVIADVLRGSDGRIDLWICLIQAAAG